MDQLKSILPEDMEWKPFAAFPPLVRLAVIAGQPSEPEPFMIRVNVPAGVKLMPHRHSEDRIYTVIAGVFYIGVGDEFDADRLQAYPPGAVIFLPSNTSHFHWAKSGEYIAQVTAVGPLGFEYVDSKDDPRSKEVTNCNGDFMSGADPKSHPPSPTRRKFLLTSGSGVAASLVAGYVPALARDIAGAVASARQAGRNSRPHRPSGLRAMTSGRSPSS